MIEEEPKLPFVIKCPGNCSIIRAGTKNFTVGQIDDEIAKGTEFGRKLKAERDKVVLL